MTSPKKLDTFEIVDEFNLSEEVLLQYATKGAQDRADAYCWEFSSVKRSEKTPVQEGNFLRHFFDIYAVEAISSNLGSDQDHSEVLDAPYKKAAKESTL